MCQDRGRSFCPAGPLRRKFSPVPRPQIVENSVQSGDFKSDLVLQHTNGTTQVWLMEGSALRETRTIGPGSNWQARGTDAWTPLKTTPRWPNTLKAVKTLTIPKGKIDGH